MTDNKFRMKGNPSLTDAFAGMDYEIEPKMVEVWNGTRIAWTIAILSALIIIPIVYLLYNSYWGESQNQPETRVENTQQSQSRPDVASAQDTPVVITAPEIVAQTASPSPQSTIDSATRALLEQQSLNEVSASIHKNKTEKLEGEKSEESQVDTEPMMTAQTADLIAAKERSKLQANSIEKSDEQQVISKAADLVKNPTITSATTSAPPVQESPQAVEDDRQITQVVTEAQTDRADPADSNSSLDGQQLTSPGEGILSAETTNDVDTQTSPPPAIETNMQLDDDYNGQSEHVNRVHLVREVRGLEPVGEDVQSITLIEGQPRRLTYFTEVKGLDGQNITYRWLREGELVFSKKVAVTGNYTWRSYISKLLVASMSGQWVVELRDDQDQLLVQNSFEVLSGSE